MNDGYDPRGNTAARRLAISGALITGTAGVIMAVYSVVAGEETGAGALLAASALAFGLLASNLGWNLGRSATNNDTADRSEISVSGPNGDATTHPISAPGKHAVGSPVTNARVNGRPATRTRHAEAEFDADPITERECEVLALVAEGYSNKLISAELGISERTVKNHLTLTMGKLRASDRAHAVVQAIRKGWLEI